MYDSYFIFCVFVCFFFFKQKTAYEMRISDWSSDVCSSDLERVFRVGRAAEAVVAVVAAGDGHLQRIEDRHVEFDECGLDVTADLGPVVLRVARRTEHPCVAQRGVRRAVELVLLAAQVHADGGLHLTAGQFETQAAREACIEDRAGALAAVRSEEHTSELQ